MNDDRARFTLRCDKMMLKDLKRIALENDTTVTTIIVDLIEKYMKEQNNYI